MRLPGPASRFTVGVKSAVRVSRLPLSALSVPPRAATSSSTKLLPGSSLKRKLITAVSPIFNAALLLVMRNVGATVSFSKSDSSIMVRSA